MDPLTYILLQKYQQVDRMKQVEQDRLLELINQHESQPSRILELSRLVSNWWSERRQTRKETPLVEGKIVLP